MFWWKYPRQLPPTIFFQILRNTPPSCFSLHPYPAFDVRWHNSVLCIIWRLHVPLSFKDGIIIASQRVCFRFPSSSLVSKKASRYCLHFLVSTFYIDRMDDSIIKGVRFRDTRSHHHNGWRNQCGLETQKHVSHRYFIYLYISFFLREIRLHMNNIRTKVIIFYSYSQGNPFSYRQEVFLWSLWFHMFP